MKNQDSWRPTKAILRDQCLLPNLPGIFGGSYHTIKLQLVAYQSILSQYVRGHLADLGCGKVPYFEYYKSYCTEITCADNLENQFTDTKIDLNYRFPFVDEIFDCVLYADVINHVTNIENVFKETTRVLKPNGNVIIFTPFLYWINEPPFDFHRFTNFALQELCKKNALEVKSIRSYGGSNDVVLDLLFKKFQGRVVFRILKAVSDLFFNNPKINDKFESTPLGYVLVAQKAS